MGSKTVEAFTVSGSRPLQPATIAQVAQVMALLDPRCDFPEHNQVPWGKQCPACGKDLFVYVQWVREGLTAWPL